MFVCKKFIKHNTERKQIRALVYLFAFDLFRRHVPERPHPPDRGLEIQHASETKIDNLDAAVGPNKNVAGFDVAMNDIQAVRGAESLANLKDGLDTTLHR